jgi:hypothetical protein
MKAVLLHEHDGLRTFAVVLSTDEEATAALIMAVACRIGDHIAATAHRGDLH